MKEQFTIRRAKTTDISEIYRLGKETKELQFSKKMKFHDKIELKEFILKPRDNILLVASMNNSNIIGFLYAKIVSKTWCILDNIATDKRFREHGIGSLLLDNLYNILKKNKISYVQILEDVHHKKTREFWKDKGFKEEKIFVWADKVIK